MPAPPQAPGNTGSLQYKNANNIVSGATTFLWDIDNNRVKAPEYSINDSSVSIKASNISGLVTGEILSDDQAVTKGYVDTYLSGIVWKKPVDFVSKPSDQVLDSNWPPGGSNPAVTALDNTGIFDGDRVLFKDQVNPKQNGIYDVNNTTGWTRSPDLSNGLDAKALAVFVLGGETEAKFSFVCNTIGSSVTVGLSNGSTNSDLTFVKFSKGEYLEAGPGLIKTGEDFRLVVDDSTLFVDINTLKVKSGGISSIHLTNLSVQEGKIANNAVTFGKIKNGAVYGDKILIGGVKNDRLENSSIGFISGDGTLSSGILTLGTGLAKIDLDTSVVRTDGRNSVTGNQNFTSLTNSTSSTTGAISLTSGGLGVKKDIWVDGKITVGGILTLGTLNLRQTGVITGVITDSSDSTSAVSKSYVDNASLGIQWKDPVTVSSVSSLSSLSGFSPSGLDSGVTLTGGERVLVKNQIPNNLNGVYISSSGDWDRSLDFNSGSVKNFAVFVEKGEDNQTSAYVVSNNPITIGTDPMIFSLFNKSIDLTPGVGSAMNKIGNELFVKVDNSTMIITGDTLSVNSIGSGQIENDSVTNIQILDGTINQSKLLGSIPITKLTQSQFTVTPGTGLTGGGVAYLGGSLTLNVDTSLFLSDSLANGTIFVGDVTNKPVSTTLSQDILITNSGVVTIQPGVITEDKIVDNAVTNNKILNSKLLLISSGGITFSTVTPGEVNLGETFEFGVDSTVLRNTGGTSNGIFNFASLENSSSSVTGAVRITGGGLGVKKDIYTETNIISTGIILKDSVDNSHSITIKVPDITGDYAMLLPTSMGSTNQVLSVQNSGTGQLEWSTVASTSTFQSVYDDSTLPEVIINDTKDGLIIRDSSTPITGDIFSVTNNSKGTKFFNVTSSGINIKGTANISGNMTLNSTGAQTITHTAASGNLTIGSTNGDVVVDSVTFNTGAVSGVTSLSAFGIVSAGTFTDGTATMTGGVLTVNNVNTVSLAATGVVSCDSITDGTATMSGGVLSGVTTANISGNMTLSSSGTQAITHTAASGNLNIVSTNGNVVVDSVTFNTGAVSGVSILTATTLSGTTVTDGTATMSGGDLSGVGIIGADSLIAVNAVEGGSITDGTATMTGGVLTANSINTGSLTATGALSGASITDGVSTMSGGSIINLTAPITNPLQAATKAYVDDNLQGFQYKDPVYASSTGNMTLTGLSPVGLDIGVTLSGGERVLVKDQDTSTENGVYISSSVAWGRATDFDSPNDVNNFAIFIENGETNANSSYVVTSDPAVISSNDIVFVQISGAGQIEAGDGLTKFGNNISVNVSGSNGIVVTGDVLNIANTDVAPGSYGSSIGVSQVTIDQQGRVTSANNVNIQNATTIQKGLLTSTDWNTFNSKLTSGLTNSYIFVGSSGGQALPQPVTGDLTLDNLGEFTLKPTIPGNKTFSGSITVGSVTDGTATISGGSLSGVTTANIKGNITLSSAAGQTITHTAASGNLTIGSTNGNVVVDSVTFNSGVVSGVTSLSASGIVSAGTFSNGVATMTGGSLSDVVSIDTGSLVATTVNGTTVTDGIATMSSGDLSGVGSIGAISLTATTVNGTTVTDGTATMSSGDLSGVGSIGATSLTASGSVSGGTVTDGTATMSGGTLSGVTTANISGNMTLSSSTSQSITHTASSGNLTIGSINGNVVVDSVTFNTGAVSGVTSLSAIGSITAGTFTDGTATMSGGVLTVNNVNTGSLASTGVVSCDSITDGTATMSGGVLSGVTTANISGNMTLSSSGAQTITHTAASGNLNISSTNGNVVVDSVTFNTGGVSGVTSLGASGAITAGSFINGTATISGGDLSGVGSIGATSLTAVNAVEGGSITDGTATMTGGVLTANSINTGSLTATGALSGASITDGVSTMSGGSIINLTAPITNSLQAATKAYVDFKSQGLEYKDPVYSSSIGSMTLTGLSPTGLDTGVTLVGGERVLVKDQGTSTENGVYISSSVGWGRATDFGDGIDVNNFAVFIENGETNANSSYVVSSEPAFIGTDLIEFSQISGAGQIEAGDGLTKTGSVLAVNVSGSNGIVVTGDVLNIANTAVVPTSYGSSTGVSQVTIDQQGRITSANTLNIQNATTIQKGLLTSTDWNTFNSKLTSGLTNSYIFVGSSGGQALPQPVTGDLTIDNLGEFTLKPTISGNKTFSGSITVGSVTDGTATISGGSLSGVTTANIKGNITLSSAAGQTITHTAASGNLTIGSTNGNVVVESVTINSGVVSGVTSLSASGAITAGTFINGVATMTGGDLSGVGSIGATSLTATGIVSAGTFNDGTATMTGGDLSGVGSIGATSLTATTVNGITVTDGTATMSSGDLSGVGSIGATSLTASGSVRGGTVTDGTATMSGGTLSGVTTANIKGNITLSSSTSQSITHTASSGNLTIVSTNGNVVVDSVTFNTGAVSGITSLDASGIVSAGTFTDGTATMTGGVLTVNNVNTDSLASTGVVSAGTFTDGTATMSGGVLSGVTTANISGNMTLSAVGAQTITHTAASGNLNISSTNGNVVVDSVTFNTGGVSGVTSLGASGAITAGSFINGTATMSGGDLSGVGSIGATSLTAVNAVEGSSITDGTATMSSGALTAVVSINTGSLTATGTVSGGTITNGTVLMSGGSITNLTSPIIDSKQAATKAYVDQFSQGIKFKGSVNSSSVGPIDLTTGGLSPVGLDVGVTLVGGERVLVKDQGTFTENGVYISSSGAWVRSTDFGDGINVSNFALFVENGTGQGGFSYIVISPDPANINTHDIIFGQLAGTENVIAGDGLTKTGSTINANVLGSNGIVVTGDVINLSNTAVVPTSYGSSTGVSQITIDQQGRITSANTLNIQNATTIQKGLLTSTDWNTFNSKLTSGLTSGNIFIGNGNVATSTTMGGEGLLNSVGEFTLGSLIAGNKTFSGSITVGSVTDGTATISGGSLSGVTTANIKGNITLSSAAGQTITHTAASGNLTISSTNGNVVVDSVTFNTGAVSGVTSLSASGIVSAGTFSNGGATMTGGSLSDVVSIDTGSLVATTVNGTTVTDGIATMTGGDLSGVGSIGATSLTASGVVSGGTVTDGTATMSGGTLSGVTTANISGNMTLSSATSQSITHTAASGNLTISSTNGNVVVDSVIFNTGAVSGITSLDASGIVSAGTFTDGTATMTGGVLTVNNVNTDSLASTGVVSAGTFTDGTATMSGGVLSGVTTANISGNMTLSAVGAQTITHTAASGNLNIVSTNGNVVVDSVTFNTGGVSGVTSLGASGAITAGSFINGTATMSGGDLSGVGSIGATSLTATNVNGTTVTDGTATMTGGVLTSVVSISAGSLTATGALSCSSITNGTVLMSGGSITNLTTPITESLQAATKAYVDFKSQGLEYKDPVYASSIGSMTLTGLSPTGLDTGVTLVGGERILVKDQGTSTENGVYISSSVAWGRSTDFGDSVDVNKFAVFIENGETNANSSYVVSSEPAFIGTDLIEFSQISGAGQIEAGDGLTKTGSVLAVNVSGSNGIVVTGDVLNIANTISGNKTFSGDITVGSVTDGTATISGGVLSGVTTANISGLFTTDLGIVINGTTSGSITLNVPSIINDYTVTLPDSVGETDSVLTTNSSGVTSWTKISKNYGYRLISVSETITSSDDVVAVDTSLGAVTITLPDIIGKQKFTIIDESGNADIENITISCDGTDTIIGQSSVVITDKYNSYTLFSDGISKWFIA